MERTIKLYSASWCQHCKETKASLEAHNIQYESIDVDTSNDPVIDTLTEIPVAISYKNGKEESRWTYNDGDISDWVKNFLERYWKYLDFM